MHLTLVENKVLPIYKRNDSGDELVNARELHRFLEVGEQFSHWVKRRIVEAGFIENRDYVSFSEKSLKPQGGRPMLEYLLTMDTAKHVAFMENNEKGREIRQYFINFEKETRKALSKRDFQREKVIEAFIQELGPYAPMYPDSFYQGLYKLLGWKYIGKHKQPGYIGMLTKQLIYTKLAPSPYEELDKRNPFRGSKRGRKWIMTRLLTDDVGKPALKRQIDFVSDMASLVDSVDDLIRIVERKYQNDFGGDRQLSFLKCRYELVSEDSVGA